jgi:PAS domain S-box-containing protein
VDSKPKSAERTSAELEQSGPVFDRARRLAGALFGMDQDHVGIVLVRDGADWRLHQTTNLPPASPGARWVVRHGQVLWVEDARRDPLFDGYCAASGAQQMGFYVAAPIRLDDGSIPGVLAVGGSEPRAYDPFLAVRLQDLADFVADEWTRVRATQARDAAHGTLASIIAAAPLSLALTDREMRLVHASPTWFEDRALIAEEAIGRSMYELAPEVFEPWRKTFERCLAGKTLYAEKAPVPRPDGGISWLQARVAPWRDAAGEVGGLIMVAHDLTQMIEAMDRTTRSEDRLKLAVEIAKLYVWELDYAEQTLSKVGAHDRLMSATGRR